MQLFIHIIFHLIIVFNLFSQFSYDLKECIYIGLENKRTLRSAELDVKSAEKEIIGSYSSLLPTMNFGTNIGRTYYPERKMVTIDFENIELDTSTSSSSKSISTGLSLNQTLYNGGRSLNSIRQAKINLEISKLNQRQTRIQVIQNVTRSYFGLLQNQELYEVAKKNLNLSKQQVELVQKQFDVGAVRKTDILKAEVAKGQARVELLNSKTALENARRQLFNEMGMQDFGQSISAIAEEWSKAKIPSSAKALELLKTKNPGLLTQKSQINISELRLKMAKGMRLPTLGATMNYSANAGTGEALIESAKDDWVMGLNFSLTMPLYTGNRLSSSQQKERLSYEKLENDYITYLNDLRVQVELLRESLENYGEIIPIYQSVVVSSEEDLKLVQERYSLGSATILEVLDAQVSLIRSNSNLINTIHDARIQEMNLNAILGLLDLKYLTEKE